ncbi:hypothetical protein [Ralstonia insidiosa]|uniref:hypothetical protein n=1 Tax=Ralstonia insidiosa TaxID=190721 RepID=UPI000CEE383C|nr:hypothetical protein [Ralstonia insidiosa]
MERTVQKLHPALAAGQRLTLTGSSTPAFSFQGSWDGGCALHAAAMALAMLGLLTRPLYMSQSRNWAEAMFWRRAEPYYLSGISLDELATVIWELNWGLRPVLFEGAHTQVIQFCEQEILRGWPVVVSWRELRRSQLHAVLVIGIEGQQSGRAFTPHTLLALDSAAAEPTLATYNARLTYRAPGKRTDKGSARAQYVAAHGRHTIELVGALSFRPIATALTRAKKPP